MTRETALSAYLDALNAIPGRVTEGPIEAYERNPLVLASVRAGNALADVIRRDRIRGIAP